MEGGRAVGGRERPRGREEGMEGGRQGGKEGGWVGSGSGRWGCEGGGGRREVLYGSPNTALDTSPPLPSTLLYPHSCADTSLKSKNVLQTCKLHTLTSRNENSRLGIIPNLKHQMNILHPLRLYCTPTMRLMCGYEFEKQKRAEMLYKLANCIL